MGGMDEIWYAVHLLAGRFGCDYDVPIELTGMRVGCMEISLHAVEVTQIHTAGDCLIEIAIFKVGGLRDKDSLLRRYNASYPPARGFRLVEYLRWM